MNLNKRFQKIKNEVGEEMWNKLDFKSKKFFAETSGTLDLGHKVDFNKIVDDIREYKK